MWERFRDGWSTWAIATCSKVTTVHNVAHYAEIVRDKSAARKLIALCTEAMNHAYGTAKAAEAIALVRDGVAELEMFCASANGPVKIGDALGAAVTTIADRSNPEAECALIPTGLAGFDKHLGGLAPDEAIVVAGRPGAGKSTWMFNVGEHAAKKGFPVLAFSLEMSQQQLLERMLAGNSGISAMSMRSGRDEKGNPLSLEHHRKIVGAAGILEPLPFYIQERILPLGAMISESRKWHSKVVVPSGKKNALIIVDYLQLAEFLANMRMSREQVVATISRVFKKLAKELHVSLMEGCQLNREIEKREDKRPQLSDLRESGAIEQDADLVLFVHRTPNEEGPYADELAEIISGKNRNGPLGSYEAIFRKKTMRFESREVHQTGDNQPDTRGDWQNGRDDE
jgi:replicative DNA helicase